MALVHKCNYYLLISQLKTTSSQMNLAGRLSWDKWTCFLLRDRGHSQQTT